MGMHDISFLNFIQKIKSWISWGTADSNRVFVSMDNQNNPNICSLCEKKTLKSDLRYQCQNCASVLCGNCVKSDGLEPASCANESCDPVSYVKSCKLCFELGSSSKSGRKFSGKIHPSESPRQSPEPPSPSFSDEGCGVYPPLALNHSVDCSTSRSDEDEAEHFFTFQNEYLRDVDSGSVSTRHEFYSVMSFGSSPSDSPSSLHITSSRVGPFVQLDEANTNQAVLEKPGKGIWGQQDTDEKSPEPLDFETNGLIWFPPPPDDVSDDVNNLFTYEDEDDEVGAVYFPTANIDALFSLNKKQHLNNKEPLRNEVEGHFRALVSQLLQGKNRKDECGDGWLDVVTTIAWQAAKYLKPDTSQGGSMDPCDYLKVKCVASGSPQESKLIKGLACTKNIKHKRMTSQYKNARLLLLRGALEYQRVPNELASFETLLQRENDQLKTIVSKIEAHRPNVLVVEKSVSSFALEHLLAKDISLVLNVKRPLLEKIARCTGASITPSTDHISTTRLGHCELFHLEKVLEEHEPLNQFNRKPSKTLMFFEGCPRRLGCTVVLRGSNREELKKVKHVVKYAVFAAYHLLLQTSFLADEGATLPKSSPPLDKPISAVPDSAVSSIYTEYINAASDIDETPELELYKSLHDLGDIACDDVSYPDEFKCQKAFSEACDENLALDMNPTNDCQSSEVEIVTPVKKDGEYFSGNDNHHSILVSFSSHCMVNGTVCERSRLLRLKFYGPSDKPLGRYLRDDLFDQSYLCRSCKEPAEAHVMCYTHQNANLTVNVRRLASATLPGERDGKIWMWHRCLKCTRTDGIPPATQRVVMSDSAWGLSFGKFLELSFTDHATGNRVSSCGHSLQRDCLRFYGFGSMVAFFRYSPINILSVRLPPSVLEFGGPDEHAWIRNEANELLSKANAVHAKISGVLEEFKTKCLSSTDEFSDVSELQSHFMELNDVLSDEKTYYQESLQFAENDTTETAIDILEINRLRHSLLTSVHVWDERLILLDSIVKRSSSPKAAITLVGLKDSDSIDIESRKSQEFPNEAILCNDDGINSSQVEPGFQETYDMLKKGGENMHQNEENASLERRPSAGSILSNQIDSAWSGIADQSFDMINADFVPENPTFRRLSGPTRVFSFDSAQRLQERMTKGLPPSSLYLSAMRSFHASGDFRYMVRDPVSRVERPHSQVLPREADKLNPSPPSFISPVSLLPDGARLMVVQNGDKDIVVTLYEKEPTSIIAYALSSKEYENWLNGVEGQIGKFNSKTNSQASEFASWQSFGTLDLDYMNYGSYTSEDSSGPLFADQSGSPHLRISFEDGKVKFSVTSYFAKQFDSLRRKCCPNEMDFVRSMSRCKRWSAQGGKSNVYFAKSFDERFIIKQVTKTELASFEEFAPEYFKYLTDALTSGSPTCLAKVLGMFQVTVKHTKGGKEVKMDLMVMENLLYKRNISKVYDLKGSARSRYNSDTTGGNKVLLDMNLLETLGTNPIFLGSKAKRKLERAVWNDTSFLASVDVMDYSLLVGVDEEGKELVMGIIDFVRQYTWDKHLETWVKASGILGGPKNASPTIISPMQYKKRFRKAMTTYFLTVPHQWSHH